MKKRKTPVSKTRTSTQRLQKRMDELRQQQAELQQQICYLAYSMTLQLQLLGEISTEIDSLRQPHDSRHRQSNPKVEKIVYLKEYLERIPH